ncbi:MAG: Spo0E like sporulation regulatory protein [Clostridia bacterium]|jgi:hypothetical protein|nr:Spo0E like sporulation regulatory protein [Clostridia bacterium]
MKNIEKTTQKIGEIRQLLQELIDAKSDLADPEIIVASQRLDEALNAYHNLLEKISK